MVNATLSQQSPPHTRNNTYRGCSHVLATMKLQPCRRDRLMTVRLDERRGKAVSQACTYVSPVCLPWVRICLSEHVPSAACVRTARIYIHAHTFYAVRITTSSTYSFRQAGRHLQSAAARRVRPPWSPAGSRSPRLRRTRCAAALASRTRRPWTPPASRRTRHP